MTVTYHGISYETHSCIQCGVMVFVSAERCAHARKVGGFFHCPNGHSQGWNKSDSEDEIIRRERDRLKQQLAQKDDEIAAERRRVEELAEARKKDNANHKREIKRIHRREAAGTCPCCSRTFQNMATHMAKQHPEFRAEAVLKVVK